MPLWVLLAAGLSLELGALSLLMWSDLIGLTRSPLCGPSCYDATIQDALLAEGDEAFAKYRPARQAAMRQLDYSPFDASAWLRVVLLEIKVGGGRMTPSAQEALAQSYKAAPVDATVAQWRIPLAFDHWAELPPQTRAAASGEVEVLLGAWENRPRLKALARRIRSDEGAFAYWLLIQSRDDEDGRETETPTPSTSAQSAAIAGT